MIEPLINTIEVPCGQEEAFRIFVTKAIDPSDSVAMDFHMGMPPAQASLVEVTFVALAVDRTRVTLTQSNWEGFGDMAEMLRTHYGPGWVIIFEEAYGAACSGRTDAPKS